MDVQIMFCVTRLLANGHTHTHIHTLNAPCGCIVYIHGTTPLRRVQDLSIIITTTNRRV